MTLSGAGRLKNCSASILYKQPCRKLIDDAAPFLEHPEKAGLLTGRNIRAVLKEFSTQTACHEMT
jgi:hypothetical protein